MSSILDDIFAAKREELKAVRERTPLEAVRAAAANAPAPRDFAAALRGKRPALIAEVKRASPSKGDILPGLDPAAVARGYALSGAACISVLTDRHFKGTLDDLRAARAAVDLPILRKDFIFDPYQVYEARAAGADCILLIVAMLREAELHELHELARELRMAALVEVHDEAEFAAAQRVGARLVGINNRNLHTFVTDIAVTERLLADYRGEALVVSESGIQSAADIARLDAAGARAFLIGESLLRNPTPRGLIGDFLCALDPKFARPLAPAASPPRRRRVLVKICGITRPEDARAAADAGADILGLNFYPPSPRSIDLERARAIRAAVGPRVAIAGVFVNAGRDQIMEYDHAVRFAYIQLHGSESVADFFGWNMPVIGAIKINSSGIPNRTPCWGNFALYDAFDVALHGGTGRRIPLEWFAGRDLSSVFISGGLSPENVGAAAALNPYAVDVASGVESAPGIKDHSKLRSFIDHARNSR